MTTESRQHPDAVRLERTYEASAELIWELWTTAAGLEEWFAPDGFETRVSELDLRPVVMTADPLHDEAWTQGYRAHRGNELDKLGAAVKRGLS
jgi:uncharacterized protein YndB with AHSA1/START domain